MGTRFRYLGALALVAAAGALAGCSDDQPTDLRVDTEFERGREVAASSGCLGCHRIADQGNTGPGPDLSKVGARMSRDRLARVLVNPTAPMPSYQRLRDEQRSDFNELVKFLAALD